MPSSTSSSRRGPGWRPLLLSAAVFAALSVAWPAAAARLRGKFPTPRLRIAYIESLARTGWLTPASDLALEELVVLGDSRVSGLFGPILEDEGGLRCSMVWEPISYRGQLTELTATLIGAKPRRLIVALSPASICNPEIDEAPAPPEGWPAVRADIDRSLNYLSGRLVSRALPSVSVDGVFLGAAKTLSKKQLADNIEKYERRLAPEFAERREAQLVLLGENLKRLRADGWQVDCMRIPTSAEITAIEDRAIPPARFQQLCDDLGIDYWDFYGEAYNTSDGSHLTPEEGARFSHALAAKLRAAMKE